MPNIDSKLHHELAVAAELFLEESTRKPYT